MDKHVRSEGLEDYIRSALDNGSTSEAVAEELAKVLNAIEKERKDEEDKKRKVEEDKKAAAEEAKSKLHDAIIDEFDEHWESGDDMTARDAALVACMVAVDNPANKDWSVEDMENFILDMTKTVEMALEIHKGHGNAEKHLDRALDMLSEKITESLAKADGLFGEDWGKMINDAAREAAEKTMKRARDGRLTLEEWIKRQGW